MKEFLQLMRRFVTPYKKYIGRAIVLNVLSAIFNVFSFTLLIPILNILFKTGDNAQAYRFMEWGAGSLKEVAVNNFYYYVTRLIEVYGPSTTLLFLGFFLAFMTMLKTSCYFGSSAVMIPLRTGVVRDIRVMVYSKVMHLPLGFFSEERKGDIIARMSGDVGEIENSITSSLDMLLKNPILIILYFSTLIVTSWQLTLFTILVLPGMGWFMGKVGKKLKRRSLEAQGKWSDTMSQLEETLGGLRIIKAFIAEDKMVDRFKQCSDELRDATNRVATRQALAHPMSEFLGTLLIVFVLWFGGLLILGEGTSMEASTFIFYMVILYSIINPLKDFAKAGYNIPKGLASMERVDKILNAENPIKEPAHPVALTGMERQIEFRDLSFSYDGKREVLKHIDLTVAKGQTIALVGQSGSGKSTLVDLLPRYHDVHQGEILIDGVNIKNFRIHDLRALIGNVNQEAILFNDTFFNNIAFGVENATPEQVMEAAKIANAHDFIMETELGYQTNIGDRGGKLSGGQRQRISIARAILKNPPILILDEATSALDTESERLVQEALERLMKTRTTIAIAHRLSTIKNADEICVLYEGEIVERGKHEELLAKNGYYKRLNDMQSLG
ncbi:ATP-binding cassette subfamily B protein/subfamily B ATP-binding cassette protein MsbA [Bacteroides heparinolyticus]|uniref:ATP-binding cassette subfamily B protein/subfamily B ATP-binding cassette protein MsbA n=1 Tax=Prevotella heparinolytica TaxID=28113 RepID=A0A4R2MC31_9BACE|nr:ABC transporter ATP-binding protein [Bacteroides heparinolyticus]TCO96422.1 ATP-binding cassette subfamily B protein/subfamily B ATP-binding cassette protein MsbA [Bacteroides heparinolyticus]